MPSHARPMRHVVASGFHHRTPVTPPPLRACEAALDASARTARRARGIRADDAHRAFRGGRGRTTVTSPFGPLVLIANPRAGRGVVARWLPEIERRLRAMDLEHR